MISSFKKSIMALSVISIVGCGENSDLTSNAEFFFTTVEDNIKVINTSFDVKDRVLNNNPKNGVVYFDIEKDTIIYKPNENFNGDDYFIVTLLGDKREEKIKYNISVTPQNDAPVILVPNYVEMDYHNVGEEWKYKISVADPEDKEIAVSEDDIDNHTELGKLIVEFKFNNLEVLEETESFLNYGDFIYNKENQTITHITAKEKTSYKEEFTVRVVDSEGLESILISELKVNYINNKPVFNGDLNYETSEDQSLLIDIGGFIVDKDNDNYNVYLNTDESIGSFTIEDNTIEYNPLLSYYGDDYVSFIIEDEKNEFNEYKIKIKVNRVIDPLESSDINLVTNEDESLNSVITYIDSEGIDQELIKFKIKSNPSNGLLKLNTDNGQFKYEPFVNFNGSDSFIVTVYDDLNREAYSTVNIEINPVYDEMAIESNISYSTVGNVHFSGNLSGFVKSIDNLDIVFEENIYNTNDSLMDVKSNGDFEFVPSLNTKNSSVIIPVEVTDGVTSDNLVVQIVIKDELMKILDTNSTKVESLGNSKYPFNNIDDLISNIEKGDSIYLCSNSIELSETIDLPDDVNIDGYSKEDKHKYAVYCENPNAEETTTFVIQDNSEILVGSNNVIKNINFDNLSTTSVIKNSKEITNNLEIDNISVTQLEPMADFIYLEQIKDIKIKNSYFFNGNKAIELNNINGEISIENNSFDNVKNPLKINEMGNNVILNIIKNNMLGFNNAIDLLNNNSITNAFIKIDESELNSGDIGSVGLVVDINNESESNFYITNSIFNADQALNIKKNGINSFVDIKNNEIVAGIKGAFYFENKGTGNFLNIENNVLNHKNNLDMLEEFSYININTDSLSSSSVFNLDIKDNHIIDNGYEMNGKDVIKIDAKSSEGILNFITEIKNNIIEDDNSNIIKLSTLNTTNNVNLKMIVSSNDFSKTIYNSLSIEEKNINGCLDLNLNKFSNLELINIDENSNIDIYDPNNEGDYSLYSRQIEINNYLPVDGYEYVLNECTI